MKNINKKIKIPNDFICREESKDLFIAGRSDINLYVEIPKEGSKIIKGFQKYTSVKDVIKLLSDELDEETICDFVDTFLELKLFYGVENNPIELTEEDIKSEQSNIVLLIISNLIFNSVTLTLMVIFIIITFLYFGITDSSHLMVSYKDIFFSKSLLSITLTITILDYIFVTIHELSHYISIYKFNVGLGQSSRRLAIN